MIDLRNVSVLVGFLLLFQNGGIFSRNTATHSMFVYYQNYEFLSTIKLNDYADYYGNVKLLRYSIPADVLSAIWRVQLIATDGCPSTYVYFYLDYSAYPVISPHNRTFPSNFNLGRLTKTYVKQLMSGSSPNNKQDIYLNVSSPYSGYWFSAAFIDTNDEAVKPDLLRTNCSFYLTASINLWQINDTTVLYPNSSIFSTDHAIYKIYKYITTSNYDGPITFKMSFSNNGNISCTMTALLRQSAFPDMNSFTNNNDFKICTSNITNCSLSIDYPLSNTWHYVAITSDCSYIIVVESKIDCFASHLSLVSQPIGLGTSMAGDAFNMLALSEEEQLQCSRLSPPIETFRFIGPTYFSVKYYFNSNYNRSNALLVRNDRKPYFIEFLIDLANNGGTLNFYLVNNLVMDPSFNPFTTTSTATIKTSAFSLNSTPPILTTAGVPSTATNFNKTTNKTNQSKIKDYNLADVKIILKACLLFNSMSTYKNCPAGYGLSTISYTNVFTNLQLSIPYPMMGKWYLALWKECFDAITNESVACPGAYVPYAVVQVSSDQCANDYCGEYGTCYIINSQLNLVSACKCSGGYQGYGCSDSSSAIPASTYLASVLFLTLSNLMFLLPICLALYRQWYIESLVYFYNMFFSTFYHACDQDFFSFCIFNYDGLQLADFISSYSSFVITILAMSTIVRPWKVFTFFVGLLACLSINLYDRFSNVAFIVFLCISLTVTITTWVKVCVTKRKLYPKLGVILKFYVPGFILALTGLLIYGFLQTKTNYWYLHSIWHLCMATSIVFFMPKRELTIYKTASTSDNLKGVLLLDHITTTTSSLSESSASASSTQSPQALLTTNPVEFILDNS